MYSLVARSCVRLVVLIADYSQCSQYSDLVVVVVMVVFALSSSQISGSSFVLGHLSSLRGRCVLLGLAACFREIGSQ